MSRHGIVIDVINAAAKANMPAEECIVLCLAQIALTLAEIADILEAKKTQSEPYQEGESYDR